MILTYICTSMKDGIQYTPSLLIITTDGLIERGLRIADNRIVVFNPWQHRSCECLLYIRISKVFPRLFDDHVCDLIESIHVPKMNRSEMSFDPTQSQREIGRS